MGISKKALLRFISLLLLVTFYLVGCENGGNNNSTDDALAVMGTPMGSSASTSTTKNDVSRKKVAITFDDGPHNVYSKKIADELSKYGAHATFFVVGNRVDGSDYNGRQGIQYVIDGGHEIAIHAYTHEKYYNKCSDAEYKDELSKTLSAIKKVSPDATVNLMRPVGGAITDERVKTCQYSVIMWDVDSEDWKYKYKSSDTEAERKEKVDIIVDNIMSQVREGSIVLMHDLYESTYDALVIVLEKLYAEGYEVVTVSELLGNDIKTGRKYFSAR